MLKNGSFAHWKTLVCKVDNHDKVRREKEISVAFLLSLQDKSYLHRVLLYFLSLYAFRFMQWFQVQAHSIELM